MPDDTDEKVIGTEAADTIDAQGVATPATTSSPAAKAATSFAAAAATARYVQQDLALRDSCAPCLQL